MFTLLLAYLDGCSCYHLLCVISYFPLSLEVVVRYHLLSYFLELVYLSDLKYNHDESSKLTAKSTEVSTRRKNGRYIKRIVVCYLFALNERSKLG